MGFQPCITRDDPFTRQVRQTYRAGVVMAPRTGIQPLDALAVDDDRQVHVRGRLANLIADDTPTLPRPKSEEVADLIGVRSAAVDVGFGANLSANFLAALGVALPSANLAASLWKDASRLVFEVREVTKHDIDIGLGRDLEGRHIRRNATTDLFFTSSTTRLPHHHAIVYKPQLRGIRHRQEKAEPSRSGRRAGGRSRAGAWPGVLEPRATEHAELPRRKPATSRFRRPLRRVHGRHFVFGLESANLTLAAREGVNLRLVPSWTSRACSS